MSHTGLLYAIAAAITWGLVYTIDQRVLRSTSPLALLFVDSVLTAILLSPLMSFQKDALASLLNNPGKVWLFLIISMILAALANFFIFSSITILGASTASIFEIAYPFFVIIFSYYAFDASPSISFLIGAFLIFTGAIIIIRG